jgi:hypothetical protein
MNDALKEVLFDEVLSYFRKRVRHLRTELEKTIQAGDLIAKDKVRATIIIEAVATVLECRESAKTAKSPVAAMADPSDSESQSDDGPRFRGLLAHMAYQCIQKLEGEFTAKELIEAMRKAGYRFYGHPDVSVNDVLQKFLKDGWVEVTEPGAGRRATIYRRKKQR